MEILHLFLFFIVVLIFLKNLLFKKPKNLPPSPPSLPILGHLHLLKKPHFRSLTKISDEYGPIISLRFGSRPVILVSSPSLIQECFTQKNDVIFTNRPQLLIGKHLGNNYTTLASSPYGHNWRFLRRITAIEMLSTNRLQMLSHIRTDEVRSMIKRLSFGTTKSVECEYRTVKMKQTLFETNLNTMMRMIAGKRYYGDIVEDMEEARRFREMVEETMELGASTNIGDFIRVFKWLGFNGLEKRVMRLTEKRDVILQELIENGRRSEEGTKLTLIDVLVSLQKSEPEYYTDQMIRGLIWVLITGGTDTSAGTMEWAMSLLVNNPKILKKAQAEIDNHLGKDYRLLNDSDLSKLPYLHAIITESLRLYPVAPLIPRESSEDCIIGGYVIPRGTMLLVNVWGIQNDSKLWDDPTEFKPERFVGLEGDRKSKGYEFIPFGKGRRSCPGEGLAMRVVGLSLGCLIQCFEWERVGKELEDMTEGIGLTIPKAQPLEAKCKPRPNMVHFLSQL